MTSEGAARVDKPMRSVMYACSPAPFTATCRRTCHFEIILSILENVRVNKISR